MCVCVCVCVCVLVLTSRPWRQQRCVAKCEALLEALHHLINHSDPVLRDAVADTYPLVFDAVGLEAPANHDRIKQFLKHLATDLSAVPDRGWVVPLDPMFASLSPHQKLRLVMVSLDALAALSSSRLVGSNAVELALPYVYSRYPQVRTKALEVRARSLGCAAACRHC